MERSRGLLLVAGLLAALLPAAPAAFGPQPGAPCEPTLLATQVALFCAPDMPTAQCCEHVVAAVDLGGGVPCLCRVAAEPQLVMAGLNATHLLTLYGSCGGLRPGGAHLAAACEGPAPPAAVVSSPPPPPPSAAPRRKQPAHDAAPPPSSEKTLSLPPHEDDGATHVKAVTAQVKAVTTAREGPIPHSLTVCPRAYYLSMSVSTECGLRTEDNSCCSLLKSIVSPSNTALCICILGESDAVKETGMNVQDIINIYAECVGVRPDIPANGCEALESAPPPATSFQYTPPPSASSSHRTILIIILSVSVFGLTLLAVYFLVAKGYGCIGIISWVKARWGADTGSNVELEPVAIVITNSEDEGHEEPQRKSSRNIQRKNYRE